jgi:hypothetical protein
MILKEPFQSRALKYNNNNTIQTEVNRYIISEYSYLKNGEFLKVKPFEGNGVTLQPVVLYGLSTLEKEIPAFGHPFIHQANNWIAFDARQVVIADSQTQVVRMRNEAEYEFCVKRFVLSGMWAVGRTQSLYSMKMPHLVFADWLANSLTRKFGLGIGDQVKLSVLALIYYAHLFTDNFDHDDLMKLKVRMAAEIVVGDLVDEVFEKAGELNSVEDFCKACYKVTNNVRLQHLDFNVLVSVVSNTWFGLNSQEVVLLSLEHPPTWIALIYAAITQRSFRNSAISKLVETRSKRGAADDFLKELTHLTVEYKGD